MPISLQDRRHRILFVGMCNSIHLARWISSIDPTKFEIGIFPVFASPPNAILRDVTLLYPESLLAELPAASLSNVRVMPLPISVESLGGEDMLAEGRVRLGESNQTAPLLFGPHLLRSAIERFKPEIVHSLEFQHSGYLVLRAFEDIAHRERPKWISTNWGSDIYYYGKFKEHAKQIKRVLENADLYSCECNRDIALAREIGYAGPALPVFPNTGGFDVSGLGKRRTRIQPSERKLIMLKGYQHFAGRALTALAVIEQFAEQLRDYEVVLYSMGEAPYQVAKDLHARGIVKFRFVSYAEHDEMIDLFCQARIYIGISVSDAISTSVLESMATGCFPIQTNTSCADEWFDHGYGGFLVEPDDLEGISSAFETALKDDELVDRAATINWDVICNRLSHDIFRRSVQNFYDVCLEHQIGAGDEL